MATEYLEHKLTLLPDRPGCYLMKDINAKIIYVGKAKNLKNRVRSYFKSTHEGKTAKLVSQIRDFETIVTTTDKEAFLLEITLIQKHQPYFNIKLKKGTGYPYIKITNERNPRMLITGQVKKDDGYYYGPYPNVYAAEETLHFLQKVYPLRRCSGHMGRPCLYYHMGQCLGACFKEVPIAEYDLQVRKIKSFLNGNVATVKRKLTLQMQQAATDLKFERAAELRDQINYIEQTVEKQKIISNDNTPRDLFNYYVDKGWISVQVFFIRQARLMKREKRIFPCINTPSEELATFILQFYNRKNNVFPKEILVPSDIDTASLSAILQVPMRTPQRGTKRDLLAMAHDNARLALEEKFRLLELDNRQTIGAQKQIFAALGLPYGQTIESFDHSHIQGTDAVSAMVSFVDGKPMKSNYRKYKIKDVLEEHNGADETANTREVVYRRYSRLLKEKKALPDLILMDGGLIELRVVEDVLHNELGINIPVAGMVKDDHHNTAHLITGTTGNHVPLDRKSQGFYLLQRIQDEVHRFAITYHRQTHSKNALSSQLESIRGVGPKTRIKLLRHFGSIKKIKAASLNDLISLGVSEKVARTIKLSL
ncbi:excinuclease ABC subunit UvrC [Bombilactobacillus thymidiniphilus]|uniref:UvrABC system protein C n=1 Tax=Bombilactobacillus thymidiniphilus TaxID=2923363 RepID=A0ABY4PDE9_9LACO|nr:excinuclease ABC subunit UvrC [Bombilactobacillus thymidiniphilus]UQS83741.1 excinuclease ABC subunit UvrC [Bombilactobacillus thymidiniphilus]